MKKLFMALVCLVSVAFFASCTKDGNPTISLIQDEGYTYEQLTEVGAGQDVQIGFVAAASTVTQKALTSFVMYVEYAATEDAQVAEEVFRIDPIAIDNQNAYDYTTKINFSDMGYYTVFGEITDAAGATATASLKLVVTKDNTLLVANSYKWIRRGAVNQSDEEMGKAGLKWTGSYKEIFATWEPAEGYKLYRFDNADWAQILTVADKDALLNQTAEMTSIDKFRDITTNNSADYNVVLGTVKDGVLNLIHVERADIETGAYGTQITVSGEIK